MSYYIAQVKPITGIRRVLRLGYFPYAIYEGTPEQYPNVRVVTVADTLPGARYCIRRDRRRGATYLPPPPRVVERVS